MVKKYLSLQKASEAHRWHRKDTELPKVVRLSNLFLCTGDAIPSLRNDLEADTLYTAWAWLQGNWTPGNGYSSAEYLVAHVAAFTGQEILWTRMTPFLDAGSTPICSTYTTGTVTATGASTTVEGTNTVWLQEVWPGCILNVTGAAKLYLITEVTDDTHLVTDSNVTATTGTAYTIYRTHASPLTDYQLHIEQWGNELLYSTAPLTYLDKKWISGPFKISASSLMTYSWAALGAGAAAVSYVYNTSDHILRKVTAGVIETADDNNFAASTGIASAEPTIYSQSVTCAGTNGSSFVVGTNCRIAVPSDVYWAEIYVSTDSSGDTFAVTSANPTTLEAVTHVAMCGSVIVAMGLSVYGGTNASDYAVEYGDGTSWTVGSFAGTGFYPNKFFYDGAYLWATNGTQIQYTADGANWTVYVTSYGGSIGSIAGDGNGTVVIVGYNSSTGWIRCCSDAPATTTFVAPRSVTGMTLDDVAGIQWADVKYVSGYFVASGHDGQPAPVTSGITAYSANGLDWVAISTSFGGLVGATSALAAVYVNTGAVYNNWGEYLSTSTDLSTTTPLSNAYRARDFAICGGYCILISPSVWDENTSTWVHNARDVAVASPGTTSGFDPAEYEGAQQLSCPGVGQLLAGRQVGGQVVLFETHGLGVLQPLGALDNPFGYQPLYTGLRAISNPLEMEDRVWFVADDGHIYSTNAIQVESFGELDLTAYHGTWTEGDAVWLSYYALYSSFVVWQESVPNTVFLVSRETGGVTRMTVPTVTVATVAYAPKCVWVRKLYDSEHLMVSYEAYAGALGTPICARLQVAGAIKGIDTISSGVTARWFADLQGGEERLSEEGVRVFLEGAELRTYVDNAADRPIVAVEFKAEYDSSWRAPRDANGTIALDASTCVGTGTAWSTVIGASSGTVFTTPCQATQGRYYRLVGTTYTALALTTDYTITGTQQVTLVTALTAGQSLCVFWDGQPPIRMAVGDLIRDTTSDDLMPVTAITNAVTATLEHYPSGDAVGQHVPGRIMDGGGDGFEVFGAGLELEAVRWRIMIVPPGSAGKATVAKVYGMTLEYQQLGPSTRGEEGD